MRQQSMSHISMVSHTTVGLAQARPNDHDDDEITKARIIKIVKSCSFLTGFIIFNIYTATVLSYLTTAK